MATSVDESCAALIDQGRTIGGDPVGHACMRTATTVHWIDGFGFPVCPRCAELVRAEPERVTFFVWRGRPGQG